MVYAGAKKTSGQKEVRSLLDDNKNVTFKGFFKISTLMLTGTIIYVTTLIPSVYGKNCIIVSLFLMLSMGFAYVILLYVAYSRLIAYRAASPRIHENRAIGLIFEGRMAIKTGILIFMVAEAARELVLRRYGSMAVALPVLVAAVYIGCRGLGGVIRFAEAVFWLTVIAGCIVFIMSLKNVDLSQFKAYTQFCEENGINCTINRVMTRGGLLFLGFSFMEMVTMIYMEVRDRRRGMLVAATGVSLVIGIIGSVIVITTLGIAALSTDRKNILYIVGAMELPGGVRIRPLMIVCYLLVVWGMMAITPHVACAFSTIDKNIVKHPAVCRGIWTVCAFAVCVYLQNISSVEKLYRFIPGYLLLIDVPLSIILPVLAINWKRAARMGGLLFIGVIGTYMCTACAYESVEDVDYATVVVVENTDNTDEHLIKYTLVIPEIGEDGAGVSKEKIYSVDAYSFESVRQKYNAEHANRLDTSHVEYIVAEDEHVLDIVCDELENEFVTSYVTVVTDKNVLEKVGTNSTKEYLRTHYKGRCLAALKKGGTEDVWR